jgi:hypothetical protein
MAGGSEKCLNERKQKPVATLKEECFGVTQEKNLPNEVR